MAKVIYGAGVSQMSGKQGGTVFSRNKSGAYTRTNRKGTNPNTTSQQNRRAAFRAASRYFRGLSAIEQQSFKDQAINYPQIDRLGQTVVLSGAQLANKFANLQLLVNGNPIQGEMGSPINLQSVLSVAVGGSKVGGDLATLTIDCLLSSIGGGDTDESDPGTKVLIKASKMQSSGFTAPKKADFRVIDTVAAGTSLTGYDIKAQYAAVFGDSFVGGDSKIFVSVQIVSLSTPQISAAVIGSIAL